MIVRSILKAKASNEVACISPLQSVAEAAALLIERRIGAVVVLDEQGSFIGLITERDIMHGLARRGASVINAKVADIMTRSLTTCDPSDTITHVARLMTDNRTRYTPVLEDGRLIGIVSIGDVVKWRVEEADMEANSLRDYAMGSH